MRGSASSLGAALAMAEGTAGVGSAGGADKATVAASDALGPRAYGKGGGGGMCGVNVPLREREWVLVEPKGMWPRKGTNGHGRRDLSGHGSNATS